MDDDRYASLEARVADLERRVSHAPAVPAPLPARDAVPAMPSTGGGSFEALVAGRGLQIAGALLVLVGTAFFLELAFTNGWIGPVERILLGLVTGSALVAFASKRVGIAFRGLADALIALGAGILYLSLWASVAVFPDLHVSHAAALAAMVAVTGTIGALAASRTSERLAFLALLGGFVTPVLLPRGLDDRVSLAAYALILTFGAVALAARCGFARLDAGALVAVVCCAPLFAPHATPAWSDAHATVFATSLFAIFASAWTIGYVRFGASKRRLGSLIANFGAYALALALIFGDRQSTLGAALLCLAAVAIGAARIPAFPRALSRTYAFLGIGALTFALPAFVHETTLLQAFTLEALGLIVLGMRENDLPLVRVAGVFFALVGGAIVVDSTVAAPDAFPIALAYAIWLAGATFVLRRFFEFGVDDGGPAALETLARIGYHVVGLAGLTRLVLDLTGGSGWYVGMPDAAEFAVSLAWTGYASLLFVAGLRGRSALMRWEGLALFALAIVKVFAVDLASLDLAWRVGSFVILGIALFAASALYTRSMSDRSSDGA